MPRCMEMATCLLPSTWRRLAPQGKGMDGLLGTGDGAIARPELETQEQSQATDGPQTGHRRDEVESAASAGRKESVQRKVRPRYG